MSGEVVVLEQLPVVAGRPAPGRGSGTPISTAVMRTQRSPSVVLGELGAGEQEKELGEKEQLEQEE